MQGATKCLFHSLRACRGLGTRQVRFYYVKKRAKKGPSGQAWLALAGVTTTITGAAFYLLGMPYHVPYIV